MASWRLSTDEHNAFTAVCLECRSDDIIAQGLRVEPGWRWWVVDEVASCGWQTTVKAGLEERAKVRGR